MLLVYKELRNGYTGNKWRYVIESIHYLSHKDTLMFNFIVLQKQYILKSTILYRTTMKLHPVYDFLENQQEVGNSRFSKKKKNGAD